MRESKFIDDIVNDLQPRKAVQAPNKIFFIWTVTNFLFVFGAMYYSGSMRPGWIEDLVDKPQYLLELLLGVGISTLAGYFLFHHAIPGDKEAEEKRRFLPVLLLAVLTLSLTISLFSGTQDTSGHFRMNCIYQMLVFSIPPLLVLLYHLKRSAPLNLYYVGFLAGLAAIAPFATAMHIACSLDPKHILIWHLSPVLVVALATAAVTQFWMRWWK